MLNIIANDHRMMSLFSNKYRYILWETFLSRLLSVAHEEQVHDGSKSGLFILRIYSVVNLLLHVAFLVRRREKFATVTAHAD